MTTQKQVRHAFWAVLLMLLGFSFRSSAQTSSPVIAESIDVAKNQILLTNNSLQPYIVTMEPMSFDVSNDTAIQSFRSLDQGISVRYSETSFRLAAKSSHVISYEAHCNTTPCWFINFSTFTQQQAKVADGTAGIMRIALHLPNVCYIYSKKPVQPNEIKTSWRGDDFVLQNTSMQYVRGTKLEAYSATGKKIIALPSFPMFPVTSPGHERVFKFTERPAYVIVSFPSFKLDSRKS